MPDEPQDLQKEWYRVSFQGTEAKVEKNMLIGSNSTGKMPMFYLAPVDDSGETQLHQVRMTQANQLGHPSGFYTSRDAALDEARNMLEDQKKALDTAMASVEGQRIAETV